MTSTEIVRRDTTQPASTLHQKMEWARAIATSGLLPRQYQNNPGNLLFAVEYADALGVKPIHAINSIHVIEGKPSASADLIAALVRGAGHKLRVMGDDTYAEAHLIRADDPEFTYQARWDLDKARAAGLLGKGVWKNYPGAMLRSRAITEVARMGASDSLFGVIYSPEELGAEVDSEGDVVHNVTTVRPGAGADRARDALGVAAPAETDKEPAPVHEPEGITAAQIRMLGALMKEAGLTDRDKALAYVADVIGRAVGSRNELTKAEASRVIEALTQQQPSGPPDEPEADGDVVDAVVVQDPPEDDEEAAAIWDKIVAAADQLGWSVPKVRKDFVDRMGMDAKVAATAELAAYLDLLKGDTAEQVPA